MSFSARRTLLLPKMPGKTNNTAHFRAYSYTETVWEMNVCAGKDKAVFRGLRRRGACGGIPFGGAHIAYMTAVITMAHHLL